MTTLPILRKYYVTIPTNFQEHDGVSVCGWPSVALTFVGGVFLLSLDTLQVKYLLVYDRQALLDLQHNVGDLSRT